MPLVPGPPPSPHLSRRRRARALAVSLTLALGLAGCSSSADGEPSPSASAPAPVATSTPSASPTPTGPTPPARPADWTRKDKRGAGAATEYLVALYNYGLETGDSTEFRKWSTKPCEFCTSALERMDLVAAGKGEQRNGRVSIVVDDVNRADLDNAYIVYVTLRQAAGNWTTGGTTSRFDAQSHKFRAEILNSPQRKGWVWLGFARVD